MSSDMMTMMLGRGAAESEEINIHETRSTIAGIYLKSRWCSMVILEYRLARGGVVLCRGTRLCTRSGERNRCSR